MHVHGIEVVGAARTSVPSQLSGLDEEFVCPFEIFGTQTQGLVGRKPCEVKSRFFIGLVDVRHSTPVSYKDEMGVCPYEVGLRKNIVPVRFGLEILHPVDVLYAFVGDADNLEHRRRDGRPVAVVGGESGHVLTHLSGLYLLCAHKPSRIAHIGQGIEGESPSVSVDEHRISESNVRWV